MYKIETKKAPAAIGPYSQAMVHAGLVFTSGQLGMDPETGTLAEGIAAQAKQALTNLCAILEAAGTGPEHVLKTTCFLSDMQDFQAFNEVYAAFFPNCPARSCVAVKTLPKNALCEVEAVCALPEDKR